MGQDPAGKDGPGELQSGIQTSKALSDAGMMDEGTNIASVARKYLKKDNEQRSSKDFPILKPIPAQVFGIPDEL